MKYNFLSLCVTGTLLLGVQTVSAQLIINELMQSNIDCIMDDLNEFPDSWVELYNPGPGVERLDEYLIGTSDKLKKAYQLPALNVEPGEFIIIYCDKGNQGLHTGFRLESSKGGSVFLFRDGEIVDKVENLNKQPAPNIAYGREYDNGDKWGYQAVPSPGMPNCNTICDEILPEPIFSVGGHVFGDSFNLLLHMPEEVPEGAIIRYTLDCSEPTELSDIYTKPINIANTTIVRAKLFCEGYLSPRSTTHSYINHPRNLTLPLVSIVSNDRYFYDDKEGILVAGNFTPDTPNYEYDWRRPINLEYFEDFEKESSLNQLCETRVKGGSTRSLKLKSMALYANKRFGTKRFDYEFFPDQTPGIKDFKSFELRNSGDDFNTTYMRDAIIQQSMGMNCDIDWQPSQPVIVYINGVYKGILNVRSRSNEDYVYSYYDGLEDIDLIENWHELKEGSLDNFNDFKAFYSEEKHTFPEFQEYMDVEEFCNLMIMNIFFDNKDFPGNNIIMWRPTAEGGKWRWIAKDTDFGLGFNHEPFDYPTLDWITTPGFDNNHFQWANRESYSRLFRRLLDTEEFRDMFIDRCAIYLGDFLTAEEIIKRIESRHDELAYEFDFHRKNLGDPNNLSENVDYSKEWISKRIPAFYLNMASYFNLNSPVTLTVNQPDDIKCSFSINGTTLRNSIFQGQYFPQRRLVIEANSESDAEICGWIVEVTDKGVSHSYSYDSTILDFEMPFGENVEIRPVSSNGAGIDAIKGDIDNSQPCDIFDLTGRLILNSKTLSLKDIPAGIYILRQGSVSKKIIIN